MWVIIRSGKGSWGFHSAHAERKTAEEWIRCLMHEAESDCQLLYLSADDCNDLADAFRTMGVE